MGRFTSPNECERFGLHNGQWFDYQELTNQIWYLNGRRIGFGDLRTTDILNIMQELEDGEVFEGYNEHHMTELMQRSNPMVIITRNQYRFPRYQPVDADTIDEIIETSRKVS